LPKGDALATARIAGIQAAKRTSEWIPLCHPLPLEWVRIEFERIDPSPLEGTKRLPSESIRGAIRVLCTAKTSAKTGVEMEALTGAAAAALTLYDMAKSADKAITIGPIQLEQKTGGKSGSYDRKIPSP
jgi:cyclic pyranopterin phosphate synthase